MISSTFVAPLPSRAVIEVRGPDWRDFLQGLITQDVVTLASGEMRFAALLTPQGRVLYDLFIVRRGDDGLIDCQAATCDALVERLVMYRLRARVEIARSRAPVLASWGTDAPPAGFIPDPRTPGLGSRGYDEAMLTADAVGENDYVAHALALGVPSSADWGSDATYPIEANFDLLGGIDLKKGCFVGQETTSRMKRRGAIRSRMVPIIMDGPVPASGAELLAGSLRAGEVRSGFGRRAIALLRLDRLQAGNLTYGGGQGWRPDWPLWLAPERPASDQSVI